ASAMAFGTLFLSRGFFLGIGRIAFRIWQVYWCHIGILLISASIGWTIQSNGWGSPDVNYIARPYLVPVFDNTGATIVGALTLTYVPGLFDILPMYLVILALIPLVMAAYRLGGRPGVAVLVVGMWLAATMAGLSRQAGEEDWTGPGGAIAAWSAASGLFAWLNLPSRPWDTGTWFFNPFAWQLVFFTGFAFGMGWLPAPARSRRLMWIAVGVLVASLPLAWHKLFPYLTGYWPEAWGGTYLWDARQAIEPLRWKTWQGLFRFVHFLALAYLAWYVAGPGGMRLNTGFQGRPVDPARWPRIGAIGAAVAVLMIPYAYVEEIHALFPSVDAALRQVVPLVHGRWIGLLQIAHLAGLVTAVWAALGRERRAWVLGEGFLRVVPVIRKVGTQSLAVFVVSIPLAITLGWVLDVSGRTMLTGWMVNLGGAAVLIGVAYTAAWFRRQPWRQPAPRQPAPRQPDPRQPDPHQPDPRQAPPAGGGTVPAASALGTRLQQEATPRPGPALPTG
ncbi:MAG: OpgC domain-containing protein, partial [Pseudomonadota bacterium]